MIRYEAAEERKLKILDIIRGLDLPNNPLDDIIDQVKSLLSLLFCFSCSISQFLCSRAI